MERDSGTFDVAFGKVIARSWSDEAYKERLLAQPREVLAEAGIRLPEGVEVVITEDRPEQWNLVLPQALSDEEGLASL